MLLTRTPVSRFKIAGHILALLLAGNVAVAQAAEETMAAPLPPHQSLTEGGVDALKVAGKSAGDATAKIVDAAGLPGGGRALRVEARKRAATDYELQYTLPISAVDLAKGDVVWASVRARMIDTQDESGQGVLGLVVEQNQAPFNKLVQRRISVGREWQRLSAPARLTKDFASGTIQLTLRVGGAAQTLELADPQFVRFNDSSVKLDTLPQTRLSYFGREPDAAWRKAADERIERLRKAPLTINVKDAAGRPVSGAAVNVAMKQHAYPFGCVYNVGFIVGQGANTPDGQTYQKKFVDLFNVGVDEYAMKWAGWEKPETRKNALDALQWMTDRGIDVRAHTMVWPGWTRMPADIKPLVESGDKAKLAKRIDDHIRDIGKTLAGRVTEWDVVNEPYINHVLMDALGYEQMAHWFKVAREADPTAVLYLNETSTPTAPPGDHHYDVLYDQAKMIQDAGAPLGGVGMQAHFGSNLTAIIDLQIIYDRFATLGVPLQITEFDIDVTDEQLQADYLRDFMTITFAHPNSSGFMMWGFWQKMHWRPDAALFRADWSIKPVGTAWIDLVKKKWWTTADLNTSADGTAAVRGFHGDYSITVTANGRTQTVNATLPKTGVTVDIVLK